MTTLLVNSKFAIDDDIRRALKAGAVVAASISGGKDSEALVIELKAYLDEIGHDGPRVCIHANLGSVEHTDSPVMCELIAEWAGWELITAERKQGLMMARWWQRWADNSERYRTLSCVQVILPWSTPTGMRFCTSELKVAPISQELKRRFPGRTIISVTGVRREESDNREDTPISSVSKDLAGIKAKTNGYTWNPLVDFTSVEVFATIRNAGLRLHEGYTKFGMERISCAFCIMGSPSDLRNSASDERNHAIYKEMCRLEVQSGFAFKGSAWLSEVAPHVLRAGHAEWLAQAKVIKQEREEAEAWLKGAKHLRYNRSGWPQVIPTMDEAHRIARMRRSVAALYGTQVECTTGDEVLARYHELMTEKLRREEQAEKKAAAKAAKAAKAGTPVQIIAAPQEVTKRGQVYLF